MSWTAALVGYAIGSVPTADAVARLTGHNLRRSGSGNPGTANALRVAGRGAAAAVLVLDITKGATATLLGEALAGPTGAVVGALGAVAGQILNPWYRLRGGKGLGVTAGVTLAAWPPGALIVPPIAAAVAWWKAAAAGALAGLTAYLTGAAAWVTYRWPTGWGLDPDARLVWLAMGVVALTAPKFATELGSRHRAVDGVDHDGHRAVVDE